MSGDDSIPNRIPWPPLLLVAVMAIAGVIETLLLPPNLIALPSWLRSAGSPIALAGLGLIAWSAWTLWRHATTVRPDRAASALVESGPYNHSRNPIYLGDTLLLLGLGLAWSWPSLLVGAPVFALAVDHFAIRPEESHLAARFPQDFAAYEKRVRRWL